MFIFFLFLFACNDSEKSYLTEHEKQGKRVFSFTNSQEPFTLDFSKAPGVYESQIFNLIFEGLMRYNNKNQLPELGIAEKYEIKNDNNTYTFTLRKDVMWSDKKKLTAHDFVASFQRTLNPNTVSPHAHLLYILVNAKELHSGDEKDFNSLGVKALNDQTLEFTLTNPISNFLKLLTHFIFFPIPQHLLKKHKEKWTNLENIVGNGAFILKKHKKNSQMIFHKNNTYWEKNKVKLDIVIVFTNNTQKTLMKMFEVGMIDWLRFSISKNSNWTNQRNATLEFNVKQQKLVPYFQLTNEIVKPYVHGFYDLKNSNAQGNVSDNRPIRCVWIDIEAKKKYLGTKIK